jgi:putative resolvase
MYTISEFAKKVNVSVHTIQRWDREGKLVAKRTLTGRRYYDDNDILLVLGQPISKDARLTVVYCRVSSYAQRADLINQRKILEEFCGQNQIVVNEWIEEIGGGLNFKRKKFLWLIDRILAKEVKLVIIAHKDRLARFGLPLIEHLCHSTQCQLLIMNNDDLSPEQEMVHDLMTIIHCFSSRLYGLRNYKKTLKKVLENDSRSPHPPQPNP